jgi:serine/threonine protein kinase
MIRGNGDTSISSQASASDEGRVINSHATGEKVNGHLYGVLQDPLIGTILAGNYEILHIIGRGGMGVVYKARHVHMERVVAIKMLQAALITDESSVKRFQQESKAASRINHPNVISLYDYGIAPTGQPFIVMDCLSGTSLAAVIKTERQISAERTIKILTQACDGIEYAHREGVVHRDLKPSNIVLVEFNGEKDFVKLVDFGVAKIISSQESQRITQVGDICGSPVYMSPEQCRGEDLDFRSDIYSLGCVLYECLTGELPILGNTMVETMARHINEMPRSFREIRPDLYIPQRLEQVIFRALAKDRENRHQSMAELRRELDLAIPRPGRSEILRSDASEADNGSVNSRPFYRSQFFQFALVSSLVCILLVGASIYLKLNNKRVTVDKKNDVSVSALHTVLPPSSADMSKQTHMPGVRRSDGIGEPARGKKSAAAEAAKTPVVHAPLLPPSGDTVIGHRQTDLQAEVPSPVASLSKVQPNPALASVREPTATRSPAPALRQHRRAYSIQDDVLNRAQRTAPSSSSGHGINPWSGMNKEWNERLLSQP